MGQISLQRVRKTRFKKKFTPQYELSRTYGKPLIRELQGINIERALASYSKAILSRIRKEIRQTAFSDAARKRLSKALRTEIGPSSLRLYVRDPLWGYLIKPYPTPAYSMSWLKKAKTPIPIVTESGEVIFRSATAKSLSDGRWVHPGRPPMKLVERAKKAALETIRAKLAKDVIRILQGKMK